MLTCELYNTVVDIHLGVKLKIARFQPITSWSPGLSVQRASHSSRSKVPRTVYGVGKYLKYSKYNQFKL